MKSSLTKNGAIKMSLFLLCILSIALYMRNILINIFLYNIHINSIILLCIVTGICVVYQRLYLYEKEHTKLMSADKSENYDFSHTQILQYISLHTGKNNKIIHQSKIQTILDSIDKKINEYIALPKYISGILIFLGLLGTFWGLSHTIGNVAKIIDSLGVEHQDATASFLHLKNSLKIPLSGMGIAFGCSLFGLSGSLIIGFLVVNLKKTSDKLYETIEIWITKHTITINSTEHNNYHGTTFSMALLEKTIEAIYIFQSQINDITSNRDSILSMQSDLNQKLEILTDTMITTQKMLQN